MLSQLLTLARSTWASGLAGTISCLLVWALNHFGADITIDQAMPVVVAIMTIVNKAVPDSIKDHAKALGTAPATLKAALPALQAMPEPSDEPDYPDSIDRPRR